MFTPSKINFLNKAHIFILTKDRDLQKEIYKIYKQNKFYTQDLFSSLILLIKNIYTNKKFKSMNKYISICEMILNLHYPLFIYSKKINEHTNKNNNKDNISDSIFKAFDYTHTEEVTVNMNITEVLDLNTKINSVESNKERTVKNKEQISSLAKELSFDYFKNNYEKWYKQYNNVLQNEINNSIILRNDYISGIWKKYINMIMALVLTCSYNIIDIKNRRKAGNDLILLTSVLIPYLIIKNSIHIYTNKLNKLNKNNYYLASNRLLINKHNKNILKNLLLAYEKNLINTLKDIYPKKYKLICVDIKKIIK